MSENSKIRILCMEDDRATASLIKKRLERYGFDVDLVYDGEQGLMMAETNNYDAATVDHKMPVYDGLEVVKKMSEKGFDLPVIMVTGKGSEAIAVEAMKIGVADYVVKDIDEGYLSLLPAVIEKAIAIKKMERGKLIAEKALVMEREQLLSIFDSMDSAVYVSDLKTYKVLYVNKYWIDILEHDPVGKLCYKEFQNKDKPCEFCTNEILLKQPGEPYHWEFYNKIVRRNYLITDRIIKWPGGKDVRLEIAVDITELTEVKDKLFQTLKDKEALLREVHHRVKNNFAIISSLLNLQIGKLDDEKTKEVLIESRQRIKSMAAIHENLYVSKEMADINLREYLRKLTVDLFKTYRIDYENVVLKYDVDDIRLDIDHMIPCGLIVNELVTNALKYSFPANFQGKGIVKVTASIEDEVIQLSVANNGEPIPGGFDIYHTDSLGLKLVKILAEEQLSGSLELKRGDWTEFIITFRKHVK